MTPENAHKLTDTLFDAMGKEYYITSITNKLVIEEMRYHLPHAKIWAFKEVYDFLCQGGIFIYHRTPEDIASYVITELVLKNKDLPQDEWNQALHFNLYQTLNTLKKHQTNPMLIQDILLFSQMDFPIEDTSDRFKTTHTRQLGDIVKFIAENFSHNQEMTHALSHYLFSYCKPYFSETDSFYFLCETIVEFYPHDLEKFSNLPFVADYIQSQHGATLWGEEVEKSFALNVDLSQFFHVFLLKNCQIEEYQVFLDIVCDTLTTNQAGLIDVKVNHLKDKNSYYKSSQITACMPEDCEFSCDTLKTVILNSFNYIKEHNFPLDISNNNNFYEQQIQNIKDELNDYMSRYFFNLYLNDTLPDNQPTNIKKFKI